MIEIEFLLVLIALFTLVTAIRMEQIHKLLRKKKSGNNSSLGKARRISELEPIQPDTPKRSTLT